MWTAFITEEMCIIRRSLSREITIAMEFGITVGAESPQCILSVIFRSGIPHSHYMVLNHSRASNIIKCLWFIGNSCGFAKQKLARDWCVIKISCLVLRWIPHLVHVCGRWWPTVKPGSLISSKLNEYNITYLSIRVYVSNDASDEIQLITVFRQLKLITSSRSISTPAIYNLQLFLFMNAYMCEHFFSWQNLYNFLRHTCTHKCSIVVCAKEMRILTIGAFLSLYDGTSILPSEICRYSCCWESA